jgi:hypothetical protein
MFFKKSEHRRTNPYVAITIGTLAMIGAFSVVKCSKKTVKCVSDKMMSMFKCSDKDECTLMSN